MTISVAPVRNEYTANAGQTIFNYTFKIFAETDLNVYITNPDIGAVDSVDLTTAYTVTGVGLEDGGTIILSTGAINGRLVTIVSDISSNRTTDYQNNGDFRPVVVNADFDRVVSIAKKIEDNSNRSVLLPQSQQGTKPLSLPVPLPASSLRWNADGTGLENFNIASTTTILAFSTPFSFTATEGQTDFDLPVTFGDNPSVESLEINGAIQDKLGNFNSDKAYTLAGRTIKLAEGARAGDLIAGRGNQISPTNEFPKVLPDGDIGNPYLFDTLHEFVNTLPFTGLFIAGDWIQFSGRTVKNDGNLTRYQVTNVAPLFILRNYENYIPLNGDGADTGVTLWAILVEGFQRDFYAQATEFVAHRGFNDSGPQNVLANYGKAVRFACDALETDWQVTSDGFPVMYHDLTLDDDTDGTGAIKTQTLAYVQALTFDELSGGFWADKIHITLVSDFFDFAVRHNQRIYIEIKDFRTIADIKLLTDLVASFNYESMTNIASFNIDDLVEVRRLNKHVNVGWLTTNINSVQEDIDFDKLQKLKYADALIVDTIMVAFPEVQIKCYNAGIGVATWGIQYTLDTENAAGVNVPRIITDLANNPTFKRGLQNVTY